MAGRISSGTERALERIKRGESVSSSARAEGVDPSTLFRALRRARDDEDEEGQRVVIVGAGALGREVAQWVRRDGQLANIVFLDDQRAGEHIVGTVESYERLAGDLVLIAIADTSMRQAVAEAIRPASFLASSAVRGDGVLIGDGCLLLPNCLVSANASLGICCIVNVHSTIGHDVQLGDFCTLASHVDICGHVTVGARVSFGSGSRVVPGVAIGDDCVIGPGAVVVRDLESGAKVYGNPARAIA